MKKTSLFLIFVLSTLYMFSQNNVQEYAELIEKAESLYSAKDYKNSAFTYSNAFKESNGIATVDERYNAACSWALANYPDSAFYNLYHITKFNNYTNYSHIKSDSDLKSLYGDKRWQPLVDAIRKNRIKVYGNIELISVNGFKLEVATSGLENNRKGKPVIVFENGMASDFDSWKAIISEMSKTSAVLAYNRLLAGGAIALLIAIIAISIKSFAAANRNPVDSLRDE
jgi:hypothetical protein